MASKMTYGDQLKHPNWQKRRLEILSRAGFACECCYDKESTLHVHHRHYVKGRMAWEYSDKELVALCEGCHAAEHERMARNSLLLASLPIDGPYSVDDCMSLVAGYADNVIGGDTTESVFFNPAPYLLGQVAVILHRDSENIYDILALHDALKIPGFADKLFQLASAVVLGASKNA